MKGVLCVLKQHVPELALAEAKAAMFGWGFWKNKTRSQNGTVFFQNKKKIPEKLGLTTEIISVFAVCTPKQVEKTLAEIDWDKKLDKPYRVTLTKYVKQTYSERDLANIIWYAQKNPKINLKKPHKTVRIVVTDKKAYIGFQSWVASDTFSRRRAHTWEAPHPSAMHPSMARALVNLGCAIRIHDPFCGAGGFLIEAEQAGIRASGADIHEGMLARARKKLFEERYSK